MDRNKYLKHLKDETRGKELDKITHQSLEGYQYLPENVSPIDILAKLDRKIDERSGGKKPAIRRKLPLLLSIAATVSLLIFAGIGIMNQQTPQSAEDLFLDYHSPLAVAIPNKGIKRDLSTQQRQDLIDQAFQHYEAGAFDVANELFHQVEREGAATPDLLFYHGLSLLASGRTEQAIQKLSPLSSQLKDPAYQENLNWYLALAYVKDTNYQEAKSLLVSLQESRFYQHKAANLLQAISKR